MTNRFFVALLFAILMYSPVNAEPRLTEVHEKLLHKAFVDFSDLVDPFSVQVRKNQLFNQTESTASDGSSFQICGELNAKNMFGGYTGWDKFVAIIITKDKGTNLDHAYIVIEGIYGPDVVSNLWPDSPCATEREKKAAEQSSDARFERRQKIEELEAEARRLYESFEQFDTQDDPDVQPGIRFRAYYDRIWSQIRSSWVIPEGVTARVSLVTVVGIRIAEDGEIEQFWIEERSGNEYYDQSALRAIRKANPLPPLPKDLRGEPLDVGINFRYPE